MEQEITISKNIVSYFYNKISESSNRLETSDPQKCYALLQQNYFVTDKDKILYNELFKEIHALVDEVRRNYFLDILGKLLINRTRLINHPLDNTKYKYFKLCDSSEDKIYFDPYLEEDEIGKLRLKLFTIGINEVEIHGLKTFLDPCKDCRFKNPYSKIVFAKTFVKNRNYNLTNEVKPFLREAKEIKIIDNYLANFLSRYHLEKLFKSLNLRGKITFVTLSKEKYLLEKGKKIEKAKENYSELEKLIDDYNIKTENIEEFGHLERYIVTDKYEITLPGGFDQFDKRGKPFINNDNKILKMFVEKK